MKRYTLLTAILVISLTTNLFASGVIDFETLPDGTPTIDGQVISTQYEAAYGVTFEIVDPLTKAFIEYPVIAEKAGALTAFSGCMGPDMPLEGQGLGDRFITFGNIGATGKALLINYTLPVTEVSGVLIDVDVHGDGTYEAWKITPRDADANDLNLDEYIIDSRYLPTPDIDCTFGGGYKGESLGVTWSFDPNDEQIYSVLIQFWGNASASPVAFDNFSPATLPSSLSVSVSASPWNNICQGQAVDLMADATGGSLPYSYQWQYESDANWIDLGTSYIQEVSPEETTDYRVIVTDAEPAEVTSDTFTLGVCQRTPDLDGSGTVDLPDFAILAKYWLEVIGP